jgi:hypothetical protein
MLGVAVWPGRTFATLPAMLLSVPLQAVAAEPIATIRSHRATLVRKQCLRAKPLVRTLNTPQWENIPL